MNRLLYILLISAISIIGFTMYQQQDIGHVNFSFAEYSFETNLIVLGAAVLCFIFAVLMIIKSLHAIKKIYHYLTNKRKIRLQDKARLSLTQGLIEYAEGRFEQSEKILLQYIKYSENRLLIYLTAARAAQQLGAHDRRDEYLRNAHAESPDADVAIGLTKAELQLAHEQNEQALATLTQLNKQTENHTYVLTLLANTYQLLQDWDNLNDMLPALKKHGNLATESYLGFEISVCNGQLSALTKDTLTLNTGSKALLDYWKKTAHHLKALPDVTEHYARQLILVDAAGEAEKELRLYLNKNWEDSSIILYSELDVVVDNKQLEMAESWLKDHQHNEFLLLALGKMCISRGLWGKAKNYLEASIAISPMPENYLRLARLIEEHMEDTSAAQEYYRQGLHLLAGDYETEVLEKNIPGNDHDVPQLKVVKT